MIQNIYELLLRSEETHRKMRFLVSKYHLDYFDFKSLNETDQAELKKLLVSFSDNNNELEDILRLQNKYNFYKKFNVAVKVVLGTALIILMAQAESRLEIFLVLLVSLICLIYIFFNFKGGQLRI